MKYALAAATLALGANASLEQDWNDFKVKYDKNYETPEEEMRRYGIFKVNVALAQQRMAENPKATHGVTMFMDLTEAEFSMQFKGYEQPEDIQEAPVAVIPDVGALPSSYDWRDKSGIVSAVKNQEQCGSCWVFSAVETIESVCALGGYGLTLLSEQQVVDCDHDGGVEGCSGGFTQDVYKYLIQVGGIETESDYPYTGENGQCSVDKQDFVDCKVASWKYVVPENMDGPNAEEDMKKYCYDNSPLSICISTGGWQTYTGGVLTAAQCGDQVDHCVQVTGWKEVSGTKVWTVRNSWSTSWGEEGYIYLEYGTNTCDITGTVTVPCVEKKDGSGTQC